MLLAHLMLNGYIVFILNFFNTQMMIIIFRFRLQRRKHNTAATDYCFSGAAYYVSTDWAHMELHPKHIKRLICVYHIFTGKQFYYRNTQCIRQRLYKRNIRIAATCFPF